MEILIDRTVDKKMKLLRVPEKPKITTDGQHEVDVPFIINWSAPQSNSSNDIKYRLEWRKKSTAGSVEPRVSREDIVETHFNIADLDYNSEYEVKLFAVNIHGESEPDIRTFKTKIDSVEKMRDNFKETTEGIENEIKELKEKLNSLKTTVEKTTREDTMKGSHEKMLGEIAKMENELREVKEKLCTLTASVGESKKEGPFNYCI